MSVEPLLAARHPAAGPRWRVAVLRPPGAQATRTARHTPVEGDAGRIALVAGDHRGSGRHVRIEASGRCVWVEFDGRSRRARTVAVAGIPQGLRVLDLAADER